MKNKNFCFYILIILPLILNAQVGINTLTPNSSSILDIVSNNKGVLIPRVSLISSTDVTTIQNPETSLIVYNLNTNADISPGFYYWESNKWVKFQTENRITHGYTDPVISTSNVTGDLYVNVNSGSIFVYNGSSWISQNSNNNEFFLLQIIASDEQLNFNTPWEISNSNVKVFRNGINVNFSIINNNTISLESGAKCYDNDEIKIFKYL